MQGIKYIAGGDLERKCVVENHSESNTRREADLQPAEWQRVLQSVFPVLLGEGVEQHIVHLKKDKALTVNPAEETRWMNKKIKNKMGKQSPGHV